MKIIPWYRELFEARCYISTGEIVGCNKYSFIYWHEYAHLLQARNPIIQILTQMNLVMFSIFVGYVTGKWFFAIWFAYLVLFMELHAWAYSIYKLLGGDVVNYG